MEALKPETGTEARPERAAPAERSAVYRSFWRKLDTALNAVEGGHDLTASLDEMLRTLLKDFPQELGFVAGRLYEKVDDSRYVLRRWYGDSPPDKLGYAVPITYAAVQELLERGIIIMKETDPGFDHTIEDPLGVTVFAAMTIGRDNQYLLSFSIEGDFNREKTLYLLSAIQHVIGQKLRQQPVPGGHTVIGEDRELTGGNGHLLSQRWLHRREQGAYWSNRDADYSAGLAAERLLYQPKELTERQRSRTTQFQNLTPEISTLQQQLDASHHVVDVNRLDQYGS